MRTSVVRPSVSNSHSEIWPGEGEADDEADSRHRHREPEGGADDAQAVGGVGGVEVEAEERARDAEAEDRGEDGGERDERLDGAVVGRREVARVEREQQQRDEARDEPAQPVDRRVLGEPRDLAAEPGHRRRMTIAGGSVHAESVVERLELRVAHEVDGVEVAQARRAGVVTSSEPMPRPRWDGSTSSNGMKA